MTPQRRWQLKKLASGLCKTCGIRPLLFREQCLTCRDRDVDSQRRARQRARDARRSRDYTAEQSVSSCTKGEGQ